MGRHVKYEIRLAGQTLTTIEDTLGEGCFGTVLRKGAIDAAIYDYDCKADAYWVDEATGERKWVTRHIKTFLPEDKYALIEIKSRDYRHYCLYNKRTHRVITHIYFYPETTSWRTRHYQAITCYRDESGADRGGCEDGMVLWYENACDALLHDLNKQVRARGI